MILLIFQIRSARAIKLPLKNPSTRLAPIVNGIAVRNSTFIASNTASMYLAVKIIRIKINGTQLPGTVYICVSEEKRTPVALGRN